MRLRNVFGILLSLFALVIVGCGGGGGNNTPQGAGGTAVSGSAAKGPITGGTVQAFEIISSASTPRANIPRIGTTVIATGTTAADGSFSLAIPPALKNGGVLFKLTGGSYKDEATGATVQVSAQAANGLRAAFSNISGVARRGDTLTVNITPFTELGVQALGATAPTDAAINAANAKVVSTFPLLSGVNILTTKPVDATVTPPAGTTAAQLSYTLALATISQLTNGGVTTLDTLAAQFLPDVQGSTGLSPANNTAVNLAQLNFLNNPNNKTGVALQGLTVAVTPTATTPAINTTVTITATAKLGGTTNVPDGTQVTFTTTNSASGTLTTVTGTTTGGVATATLTSATDAAAFVVTAKAGGQSGSTPTITFADPNKPGAITLAASSTSAATNSPVTLTATVAAAGGAGFTVPNGTVVTFTITSGTGTLTGGGQTATATTTNGVATTSLTSVAVGAVTVNAKAGTAPVVTSTPATSVSFVALVSKAILKLNTTGSLQTGVSIGAWDADIQFPASVTINNGTLGALAAPAFALSGTDSSVALPAGNGNATSNAADGTHVRPFVSAAFFISGTGITTIGEVATFTFDLVTPTATPTLLATDFVLNPTNVNSSAVGAPSLKPGTDLGVTLTFQ